MGQELKAGKLNRCKCTCSCAVTCLLLQGHIMASARRFCKHALLQCRICTSLPDGSEVDAATILPGWRVPLPSLGLR